MRGDSDHASDIPGTLGTAEIGDSGRRASDSAPFNQLHAILSNIHNENLDISYLAKVCQDNDMRVSDLETNRGQLGNIFIEFLHFVSSINETDEKIKQINFFCKVVPYIGPVSVDHLEILIPKLISGLLSNNTDLKRSTLNTLHTCVKHASNRVDILRVLVKHGIEMAGTKSRTEIMLSLPILVTADVAQEDLFDVVHALVRQLNLSSGRSSASSPAVICLARLKDVLQHSFYNYIFRLPKELQQLYELSVENRRGSLAMTTSSTSSSVQVNELDRTRSRRSSSGKKTSTPSYLGALPASINQETETYLGIVPEEVMSGLRESQNWQVRGSAMDKLAGIIRALNEVSIVLPYLDDFFQFLLYYLEDPNFRVQLRCFDVLTDLVEKLGTKIRPHLQAVSDGVLFKLGDGKTVVKHAVTQVVLQLMRSVGPELPMEHLFPLLEHKNSKVRVDAVDVIITALLSIPTSQFDFNNLCKNLAPLLLDNKRKVRHSVLECFSLIAQSLGQGRLNPIVTAVDYVELQPNGDGVMEAVQARIARTQLPRLNAEGMIEYAVQIPTGQSMEGDNPLDINWILKARGDGTAKTSGSDSKRYFSAGKRRLPWEATNDVGVDSRKAVGSAPLRAKPLGSSEDIRHSPTFDDGIPSGIGEGSNLVKAPSGSYLGSYVLRNKMPERPELNRSDSQGSYFKLYKNKMKLLKQAGLQSDQNVISSLPTQTGTGQGYALLYKKGMIAKGSNGEIVGRAKSGPQTLSPIRPNSLSPDETDDHILSSSWSGSEAGNQFDLMNEKGKRNNLKPISAMQGQDQRISDSPVCMKPQLARSASKKRHQNGHGRGLGELSGKSVSENDLRDAGVFQSNGIEREFSQGSPFDSKPRLLRSSSGKGSSGRLRSSERLSPLVSVDHTSGTIADVAQSPRSTRAVHSNERYMQENYLQDNFHNTQQEWTEGDKRFERHGVNDSDSNNNQTNALEDVGMDFDSVAGQDPAFRKSPSGLSKSALERAQKKRMEEKMKMQMEQQLKDEKKAQAVDRKKEREMKSREEIKKLESLILSKQQKDTTNIDSVDLEMSSEFTEVAPVMSRNNPVNRSEDESGLFVKDQPRPEIEKQRSPRVRKRSEAKRNERRVTENGSELPIQGQETLDSGFVEPFMESSRAAAVEHVMPGIAGGAYSSSRYESFDVDVSDLRIGSDKSPTANSSNLQRRSGGKKQGIGKPPVSSSPRLKRKSINSQSVAVSVNAGPACIDNECLLQQSTALSNPEGSLKEAMKLLAASGEDWDLKCNGLHLIRCLATHHSEILAPQLHAVSVAAAGEVKNLRSQVSRASLVCLGEMFRGLGRTMEPETEAVTKILLGRTCDTNEFIREDAEKALTAMVQNVSPKHAMVALIQGGASHRNKDVRKVCARLLVQVMETIGYSRLLNGTKDITDRIIPTASHFAVDGQPETRYFGRKMLYLMMEHPNFEKLLEKHLEPKNLRPIKDLVQNLRSKGLGEPPNVVGSAGLRKSVRQSESATNGYRRASYGSEQRNSEMGSSLRGGSGNSVGTRSVSHKPARFKSREEGQQGSASGVRSIDLDSLKKLTSNDWREKMEGIDVFLETTEINPEGVATSIVKVFDRFAPRLADSNSKVMLHALQGLSKTAPILGDALIPVLTITIQNLQGCIASKNDVVFSCASSALDALVQNVDPVALVPPLVSVAQYSNTRIKPELAARLAEIVPSVYSRKPNLIGKSVMPLFWSLVNAANTGSAGAGRNDLSTATASLANQLYVCFGESLLEEAESQGSRVKQRLQFFLGYRS